MSHRSRVRAPQGVGLAPSEDLNSRCAIFAFFVILRVVGSQGHFPLGLGVNSISVFLHGDLAALSGGDAIPLQRIYY